MSGPGTAIRPVRPGDAPIVAELLRQLGYPQDDPAAVAARIRAWDADPASAVYAAEAGGDVHGLVAVHVCPYFERPGAWGRIVALVVADHARGKGIGGRLVAAAEAFAAGRGCVRMEVTSNARRSEAHEFYRRRGYVDQEGRSSRFVRELDDAQD
jgi:GNAT superfamily N-acetyltransferase